MQCIIMENTLTKLTRHDETKKRAHDSQFVMQYDRQIISIYLERGNSNYNHFNAIG